MVTNTDKQNTILTNIIAENPGLPAKESIYVYCNNKIPVHKGTKTLQESIKRTYGEIAIKINKTNYICLDFDGYSNKDKKTQTKEYKEEKRQTATIIKDNFIQLLEQYTKKYRLDQTASKKFHLWLQLPETTTKEQLILDKFLTKDGHPINDIVEVFSKYTKHNVHLAGSQLTTDTDDASAYTNIYAGATFENLDRLDNIKPLLTSAITSAGYLIKITNAKKVKSATEYEYYDANHDGIIKETHYNNVWYFSYLDKHDCMIHEHFYKTTKDEFSIEHIIRECPGEHQSILQSIYYYHQNNDEQDAEIKEQIVNQEISTQIIELYNKYWNNTIGKRHRLMLATSHVLVKHFNFNESDLELFYNKLDDNVDIDPVHEHTIKEGYKTKDDDVKKIGIPAIVKILNCTYDEIEFLTKYSVKSQHELEYLEKIKPTVTDEILDYEKLFQQMYQLQQDNYFDGINSYIKIEPTSSITSLIAQTLGNSLLKENTNIARLLLTLVTAMIGIGRTYIIVTGVSSGGKSAIVDAVKLAIPDRYKYDVDDSSDKAFIRYVENKGKDAYDRMILDLGDKGALKEHDKTKDRMQYYKNLITKGSYNYQVTNKVDGEVKGTIDLTVKADGFAEIISTTKDAIANHDAQILTRSQIINVTDNSYDEISNYNAELGQTNSNNNVKELAVLFQNHFLYHLNKYNNTDNIIVEHWKQYIKDLLVANNGVNREIEYTMNAFKTYCWIEIERLEQIKGTDGITYYIPDSNILCEFIRLYGVKSNSLSDTDINFINWLQTGNIDEDGNKKPFYAAMDEFIDDAFDLNTSHNRKDANVFIYKDIELLLKSKNPTLSKNINNVSDTLKKLEKSNILCRLADKTNKGNVIYYFKEKQHNRTKTFTLKKLSDDNVEYAFRHLKEQERITTNYANDKTAIFRKSPLKFDVTVDFSFIDQRAKTIGNNKNNNDGGDGAPGDNATNNTASTSTIIAEQLQDSNNGKTNIDDTKISNNLVNLHCHTDESTGDGAISIERLVNTAIQHNQKAIALTNHGTLNGLYKFNKVCRKKGIKAILGIEAYITKDRYHLILLAKNLKGYQDLLTLHNKNVQYMKEHDLKRNDKYVNGGIYYSSIEKDKHLLNNIICLSGCISGQIPQLLLHGEYEQAKALAIKYNSLFNQFYLELQYNGLKEQTTLNDLLIELSNDTGIPLTVTGDVHYISNKDDWNAIKYAHRKGSHAPQSNNSFMTNAPVTLAQSTIDIADSIASYDIQASLHIPKPKHNTSWLKTYCYNKLKQLGIDDKEHKQRLEKELKIIKGEIANYHILLYEIVELIKPIAGAPGGRGSAVGSLVCYLLGFHEVDPIKYGLLFERFLNVERIEQAIESDTIDTSLLPDIDLNIRDDRKDEVFATLEKHYDYIAKVMTYAKLKPDGETIKTIAAKYPASNITGLKYNSSIHAGGVILSTEPFNHYLPVTLTRDGEIVTDCDLTEVEARGGVKYDLLGESSTKINDGITLNDNEINKLVKYTVMHPIGISQFTGYAALMYFKTHNVTTFDELVKASALIRPGSNETIDANNSWIFQEDMMQEAVKYGISYADADYIRKPRGTEKEKQEKLDKIINTMLANGCSEKEAMIFKEYHNNYSFNKSHAVAYTLESLKNAKLKRDNTALFFEKKLNHAKNPISIAQLFDDAIKLGVDIVAPGRTFYKLDAMAVNNKLYVGTKFIKGINSKEPLNGGKFNKTYKNYLKLSKADKLYSIGAYDKNNLPANIVSVGYETKRYKNKTTGKVETKLLVATVFDKGLRIMSFKKSNEYKPADIFNKGNVISGDFIKEFVL